MVAIPLITNFRELPHWNARALAILPWACRTEQVLQHCLRASAPLCLSASNHFQPFPTISNMFQPFPTSTSLKHQPGWSSATKTGWESPSFFGRSESHRLPRVHSAKDRYLDPGWALPKEDENTRLDHCQYVRDYLIYICL